MRTLVTLLAFILVIGTVPLAIAQTTGPLVAEGLSLPRDHQYERYDAGKSTYTKVDVSQVPALVKQKQPIYDRTAKAWVYNSPKGLDPRYAAAAAPATAPATTAPAAKAPAATAPAATAPTSGDRTCSDGSGSDSARRHGTLDEGAIGRVAADPRQDRKHRGFHDEVPGRRRPGAHRGRLRNRVERPRGADAGRGRDGHRARVDRADGCARQLRAAGFVRTGARRQDRVGHHACKSAARRRRPLAAARSSVRALQRVDQRLRQGRGEPGPRAREAEGSDLRSHREGLGAEHRAEARPALRGRGPRRGGGHHAGHPRPHAPAAATPSRLRA